MSISYALCWLYDFCLTTSYTNLAVCKLALQLPTLEKTAA